VIPSPFVRALYLAGAGTQRLACPEVARAIAFAERSCPGCAAAGTCQEWLESGAAQSYGFCPNAALVERLTVERRA
jgi:hypothetical protein